MPREPSKKEPSPLGVGIMLTALGIFFQKEVPGITPWHIGLVMFWVGFFVTCWPYRWCRGWWGLVPFILALITTKYVPEVLLNREAREIAQPFIEETQPIEKKILLYERYGGEWHTSNREPIFFTSNQAYLRNHFVAGKAYRFMPMIYNGNENVSLAAGVELYIEFPPGLTFQETKMWRIADIKPGSTTFYTQIPVEIHPGGSMGINESLFIIFPGKGRHPVKYYIRGRRVTGEGFKQIVRNFDFVME